MGPYVVATVIVGAAAVVGQGVLVVCGTSGWSWLAPAVGLAALLIVSAAAVKLPGDGLTAAVVLVLVVAGGAAVLWRTAPARRPALHGALDGALAGGAAAALTAVPFLATGRVGLQGVSLNNDTAVHLLWADGLRSAAVQHLFGTPTGYPLGPHSLMAAIADGTGIDMDRVMTGLLIAVPVITTLAALEGLRTVPRILRAAAAVMVAFSYMLVAWYAQGAFKELIHALFVLGFAVGLPAVLAAAPRARWRAAIPLGLLVAGSLLTYSYLAVVWYGATLVIAGVLLVALYRPRPAQIGAALRSAVAPLAVGAGAVIVGIAVEIPRIAQYFTQIGVSPAGTSTGISRNDLGNLPRPLGLKEAVGVWPTGDFRFPPPPGALAHLELLQILAIAAIVFGAAWVLLVRREVALPAALLGALAVYLVSRDRQSPYVTAKALVVLAPLMTLAALRGLLEPAPVGGRRRQVALWAPRLLVAAVLVWALGLSSAKTLRAVPVESAPQRDELGSLRAQLAGRPGDTLFLGIDDYAGWRLRGLRLSYPPVGTPAPIPFPADERKPYKYGDPADWDSVSPAALDRFRYVITVRSPMDSSAPPNFHLVRRTSLYELWERRGPTPARAVVESPAGPGATLDCRRRSVRRLRGTAVVWPNQPLFADGSVDYPVLPGHTKTLSLDLPPGTFDLALQYTSAVPVRVRIGGQVWNLPATTTRPGPWWPVGRLDARGGIAPVEVVPETQSRLTSVDDGAIIARIAAAPVGPLRRMPVRRACGSYVDRVLTG